MRPENELGATPTTTAIQEIRSSNAQYLCGTQPKPVDPCYTLLSETPVSIFEYHPTHNHWHTADVALFEVRKGSPTGTVVGKNSIKVGFCLLDLYKLDDNAPTSEKTFWDCYTSYQGVSAGWVDQYHQATDGQEVDLTGVAERDRLLPGVDDEPDQGLPRAGQDEQLRVGEVHALDRLERQPEGDRHRPLSVRERGALRRALGESMTRCGRGWCLSPSPPAPPLWRR